MRMHRNNKVFVSELNYRDVEDTFNLKLDHLFRYKNKADLENHILKKEIAKIQENHITLNPKI